MEKLDLFAPTLSLGSTYQTRIGALATIIAAVLLTWSYAILIAQYNWQDEGTTLVYESGSFEITSMDLRLGFKDSVNQYYKLPDEIG